MFRVGQKVVCVDGGKMRCWACRRSEVVAGQIYTIRGFEDCGAHGVGIVLEEVRPKPHSDGECSWKQSRFRPVVDISDLEAIVREQMLGKPRKIAPDKFDRQRIHSAASPVQRDASAHPSASGTAGGRSPAVTGTHSNRTSADCPWKCNPDDPKCPCWHNELTPPAPEPTAASLRTLGNGTSAAIVAALSPEGSCEHSASRAAPSGITPAAGV